MGKYSIARATIVINAPNARVWNALVDPAAIRQYWFGTQVVSDWQEGSAIVWNGVWEGNAYEDKGVILKLEQGHIIQYSHYSPLSGAADEPENYHKVTVELSGHGDETRVDLAQDNNANEEERIHSEKNWEMMLANLKQFVEQPKIEAADRRTKINPAMESLSVFLGEWKVEAIKGEMKQTGRAKFEWLEGGAFLIEKWDFNPADLPPAATWIIGSDESTDIFSVLYYDARSVSRVLQMTLVDGTWKLWRNDPGFSQRFTGKFSQDKNTITVYLEKSFDSADWEHDFDLIFTRVGKA